MAYTTIDNPHKFFNTVLYTGNGTTDHAITGVGFQPDWTWLKKRNNADDHILSDAVRGATKYVISNSTAVEGTYAEGFKSFDSDGFTLGNANNTNQNTHTFAAWNWRAGNSSGSSNGDGSITSTVSVNTTAGFSIVSYTGTGSAATVGHGLGAVPKMFIVKNRDSTESWRVYHNALGATKEIYLDLSNAAGTSSSSFNDTEPTSSVFSVGTGNGTNKSGENLIAYCFTEIQGYSKFGSYTGQGGAGGQYPFIYTGFKPAWVMTKRTDSTSGWIIRDNKRDTFNPSETSLYPNANTANDTSGGASYYLDFLSNGFKFRGSGIAFNASSGSYIYMAFAEHPFVTEGTKAAGTAR